MNNCKTLPALRTASPADRAVRGLAVDVDVARQQRLATLRAQLQAGTYLTSPTRTAAALWASGDLTG